MSERAHLQGSSNLPNSKTSSLHWLICVVYPNTCTQKQPPKHKTHTHSFSFYNINWFESKWSTFLSEVWKESTSSPKTVALPANRLCSYYYLRIDLKKHWFNHLWLFFFTIRIVTHPEIIKMLPVVHSKAYYHFLLVMLHENLCLCIILELIFRKYAYGNYIVYTIYAGVCICNIHTHTCMSTCLYLSACSVLKTFTWFLSPTLWSSIVTTILYKAKTMIGKAQAIHRCLKAERQSLDLSIDL